MILVIVVWVISAVASFLIMARESYLEHGCFYKDDFIISVLISVCLGPVAFLINLCSLIGSYLEKSSDSEVHFLDKFFNWK